MLFDYGIGSYMIPHVPAFLRNRYPSPSFRRNRYPSTSFRRDRYPSTSFRRKPESSIQHLQEPLDPGFCRGDDLCERQQLVQVGT
jgi:hypothetical protein